MFDVLQAYECKKHSANCTKNIAGQLYIHRKTGDHMGWLFPKMIVMMSGRVSPRWSPGGSMRGSEQEEEEEEEEEREERDPTGTRRSLGSPSRTLPPIQCRPDSRGRRMLTLLDRVQ